MEDTRDRYKRYLDIWFKYSVEAAYRNQWERTAGVRTTGLGAGRKGALGHLQKFPPQWALGVRRGILQWVGEGAASRRSYIYRRIYIERERERETERETEREKQRQKEKEIEREKEQKKRGRCIKTNIQYIYIYTHICIVYVEHRTKLVTFKCC